MSELIFAHQGIILDACCLINLYASRRMEEILKAIPKSVYVKDREILKTYDPATDSSKGIELQPFIEQNLLIPVDLDMETEAETWVNFSVHLDDGEAVTGAIAFHRNWAIATDDKRATNLFQREASHLQIITTPELMKHWADTLKSSPEMITQCLQNIASGARYRPPRRNQLYPWWQHYFLGED